MDSYKNIECYIIMYGSMILRNTVKCIANPISNTSRTTYNPIENKPYSQYCHYISSYCELYPNIKTTHYQVTEIYQSIHNRLNQYKSSRYQ